MRRWTHLFGAILLFLFLWTGTAAYADRYLPVAVAGESATHFDGDKDQVPSDEHNSLPHHHVTCGEHFAVAADSVPSVAHATGPSQLRVCASDSFEPLRQPDSELRPPIA